MAKFSPRWANRKRNGPAGKDSNANCIIRYNDKRAWLRSRLIRICLVLGGSTCFVAVSLQILEIWYRLSILSEPVESPSQLGKDDMYTVSIISQNKRWGVLEKILKHYSTCPKVQSISVVWDGSTVPLLGAYSASKINISFRNAFKKDSLNNRFFRDATIGTEAVLSVDDDLLVSCNDVLRAFAQWKESGKDQLVGFLPRLVVHQGSSMDSNGISDAIDSESERKMRYLSEKEAIHYNKYNVILTPLMVYHAKYMELYWSDEYTKEREFVDSMSNCEDLLMNYIVSYYHFMARGEKGSHARFLQPRRRLDISRLSSCGVSCGNLHLNKRQKCAEYFEASFRSRSLSTSSDNSTSIKGNEGSRWNGLVSSNFSFKKSFFARPVCWIPGLGCIYH